MIVYLLVLDSSLRVMVTVFAIFLILFNKEKMILYRKALWICLNLDFYPKIIVKK